jgi:hypothetical protein
MQWAISKVLNHSSTHPDIDSWDVTDFRSVQFGHTVEERIIETIQMFLKFWVSNKSPII